MKISFCITSDLSSIDRLFSIIQSIEKLTIPEYEIIIIGESSTTVFSNINNIKYINFDNPKYKKWITRKKNILSENAKYNNIVMMHDYFLFDNNWYTNYLQFGEDWDVCSNAQHLMDNRRHYTDWVIWDDPKYPRYTAMCYDNWSRVQYMYISGGYYLVKKDVAINNPLNEDLLWGMEEDVEWSLRIRNTYKIKCNGKSLVTHCKSHRDLRYAPRLFENCHNGRIILRRRA